MLEKATPSEGQGGEDASRPLFDFSATEQGYAVEIPDMPDVELKVFP